LATVSGTGVGCGVGVGVGVDETAVMGGVGSANKEVGPTAGVAVAVGIGPLKVSDGPIEILGS
jgi:hypothetical protein